MSGVVERQGRSQQQRRPSKRRSTAVTYLLASFFLCICQQSYLLVGHHFANEKQEEISTHHPPLVIVDPKVVVSNPLIENVMANAIRHPSPTNVTLFPRRITVQPNCNPTQTFPFYNGSVLDASCAPFLMGETLTAPIQVRILLFLGSKEVHFRLKPAPFPGMSDELLNICYDGMQRSPYFDTPLVSEVYGNETLPLNNYTVWVVDMRRMQIKAPVSIPNQTYSIVERSLERHIQEHGSHDQVRPKVIFMDYRDRVRKPCHEKYFHLADLLGSHNVRFMIQQRVRYRRWKENLHFVAGATLISNHSACVEQSILSAPYTVRSDYDRAVVDNYSQFLAKVDHDQQRQRRLPPDTERPLDVAHFWSYQVEKHAKLRNAVTVAIQDLNGILLRVQQKEDAQSDNNSLPVARQLTSFADSVSTQGAAGRVNAQDAYVNALLTTKIVVTAQRDKWEDHYRFFESMISGALVFTDPMETLPAGFENGINVIVYESLDDMKEKIVHYLEHPQERLAIARRGWNLARSQHMPEHWMERLFMGSSISTPNAAFGY